MKALLLFFISTFSIFANEKIQQEANEFLRRLDGNYKERKEASKQLNNLPVDFYPYLKKHLEQEDVSLEVKLRLSKEKMFPLRSKWIHNNRMDWYRKHTVEAYKKFGHKNPKWDKEALAALELVLTQFNEYWYIQGYANSIADACEKAIKKGCKDPLILYFNARGKRVKLHNHRNIQLKKMHLSAQAALKKSKYHDYFKFRATRLAGYYIRLKNNYNSQIDNKGQKAGLLKMMESLPYYQETIKDKNFPFVELFYNSEQFCTVYKDCGKSIAEGLSLIKPLLLKQFGENSQELLATEGIVELAQATDLRRNNYEQGRIAQDAAIKTLGDSWNLDPAKQDIAVRILKILKDREDREGFEKWYNNILLADPGNLDAFAAKRDFLHYSGSLDDLWTYGEEIVSKGGPMTKQIPSLIDKIGVKIADSNPKLLFDFNALYKHKRAWELLSRAYEKYSQTFPNDKNYQLLNAYYASYLGYWDEAHQLFTKAGPVNQYKGRISIEKIKETKLEAALYQNKKIPAQVSNEHNFNERIQAAYENKKKGGHYDFWRFYKELNGSEDNEVQEVFNLLTDDWYGKPEVTGNTQVYVQEVFEKLTEIRNKGNKDPLVYMMWAHIKDSWYKGDKSEYFKAAQLMVESKYPANLKLLSICMGTGRLGYQKSVSKQEKDIITKLVKRAPEFVTKKYIWPEQYYYLFNGLSRLKLLSPELAEPIIKKYKDIGQMTEHFLVQAHFNNRMAWYTHSLSKKKNWKLINKYNRDAKISMKNAWMNDPNNAFAAEGLFRFTDKHQGDYTVNLRRALFANPFCYSVMRKFMDESSDPHSRSRYWSTFPILETKVSLLHHKHALDHAKARKEDPDVLNDHWYTVDKSFVAYLNKFPNATVTRSQYALYAIKCNKDNIVLPLMET